MDFEKVGLGECRCPGAPHEADELALRPKLGLAAGIELQERFRRLLQMEDRPSWEGIVGELTEMYLLVGVAEWNLVDDLGPIPVTRDNIRRELLADFERARTAADKADDLYYGPVLAPLVASLSTSLRGGRRAEQTSAAKPSSPKPRKRSKPSSTSTTPTDATATTTS